MILFILIASSRFFEADAVVEIDEDTDTTQDYAVQITNPPSTVTDPEVYYNFFKQFGEICFVTIVKNNGGLCMELALKKSYETQVQILESIGDTTVQDTLPYWKKLAQQYLGYFYTIDYLKELIKESTECIEALSHKDYKPWKVFIIFNNQIDQRMCLIRTSVPYYR